MGVDVELRGRIAQVSNGELTIIEAKPWSRCFVELMADENVKKAFFDYQQDSDDLGGVHVRVCVYVCIYLCATYATNI